MKKLRCLAAALSCLGLVGCSTNLSRFDVVNILGIGTKSSQQITRAETADQGSGAVSSVYGPGGHSLSRVTVGGYYLRRADVAAAGGTATSAGLHGNPRAKR